MQQKVSFLVESFTHIHPNLGDDAVNGAMLSVGDFFRSVVKHPQVDKLELFMPPVLIANRAKLEEAAHLILAPELRGKGKLSFYPFHSIPEVWSDGTARILRTADPQLMARDRYLRDRFATGPTPISADTHVHGVHWQWAVMEKIAKAPPVSYDALVSISTAHAESTRKLFDGFLLPPGSKPPFRIEVIARAVDFERFKPVDSEMKAHLRRELGWPVTGQIALYLARVTAHGKADIVPLVRAFAEVSSDDDTLVIVGGEATPGTMDRLRHVAQECDLGSRFMIAGEVKPEYRWKCFAAADLYVLPGDTIQEAFGMTVVEAMSTGLPVITSEWDGFRDTVSHGETGFLIPTWWVPGLDRIEQISPIHRSDYLFLAQSVYIDRKELAKRLGELLRSEDLRKKMGAAGRARAETYSNENVTARLVSLWDEQLQEAIRESEESKAARRDRAKDLAFPTPFLKLFDNYATGVLDSSRLVQLSSYGRRMIAGEMGLGMYEEALAITHGHLFEALLRIVSDADPDGISVSSLVAQAAQRTGANLNDAMFHLGLLLKSDAFDLVAG